MKILKIIILFIVSLALIAEFVILGSGKTFLNKVFAMTVFSGKLSPDIDEMELFEKREIKAASPQAWPVSSSYGKLKADAELLNKCEDYKTVAFLVIKNDSLAYEKYWENYGKDSYSNSFSMAKSFTAALIGVALKEGKFKTIDEKVGNYLPEFREGEKAKITIRHLLTMSSGLAFDETYSSPWAWPSEAYYGPDVNNITINVKPATEPGKTWNYKGGDSQLLGMILKKITGKNISDYASEKLWQPMGAELPAYWSLDDKGMEKVSCCWYTNARDYARFAKLYMNYGNWNGNQLIDSSYIAESIVAAPLKDRDGKDNDKYGFQWWVMKHKGHDIFYCRGIRGQYIFAIPDEKMIVVRLGHKRATKKGDELPEDIYVYLDAALGLK